jgi:fumarylacetoacetate (FAA) hydrolase family protein
VGPGQFVRIRKDSRWNVPEPELVLVITPAAKIIGFTIGNDMSSRDIEVRILCISASQSLRSELRTWALCSRVGRTVET